MQLLTYTGSTPDNSLHTGLVVFDAEVLLHVRPSLSLFSRRQMSPTCSNETGLLSRCLSGAAARPAR